MTEIKQIDRWVNSKIDMDRDKDSQLLDLEYPKNPSRGSKKDKVGISKYIKYKNKLYESYIV